MADWEATVLDAGGAPTLTAAATDEAGNEERTAARRTVP